MSVLVEGMDMPTDGGTICVYKVSGKFFAARAGKDELFPIIPIPELHGRLIDADALYSHIKDEQRKCNYPCDGWSECQVALGFVNSAPTVIPAEERMDSDDN